jgi:hypothetical protein
MLELGKQIISQNLHAYSSEYKINGILEITQSDSD